MLAWAKMIEMEMVRSGQIQAISEHGTALLLMNYIHNELGERRI